MSKLKFEKFVLIIGSVSFVLLFIWMIYGVWGRSLMDWVYKTQSVDSFLWLPEHDSYSVDYYFKRIGGVLWCWTIGGVVLVLLYSGLSFLSIKIGWKRILCFLLFGMIFYEMTIVLSLEYPTLLKFLPRNFGMHIKDIYDNFDMNSFAFNADCSQFDSKVYYRLRPGRCEFSNREFHNEFLINRQGFRDDEKSLQSPDVIVLGDSFSMGWGVNQQETYAQVIEKEMKLKVLNTGTASFDTVREMRLLDQLDTSQLKYLIIQYCSNDFWGNWKFYRDGNQYTQRSEKEYKRFLNFYKRSRWYYPGKYIFFSLSVYLENFLSKFTKSCFANTPYTSSIKFFLNALMHASNIDLSKVKIIVFQMNSYYFLNDRFILSLKKEINSQRYPQYIKNAILIDSSKTMKRSDYYILDRHLNAQGHRIVAQIIMKENRKDLDRPVLSEDRH